MKQSFVQLIINNHRERGMHEVFWSKESDYYQYFTYFIDPLKLKTITKRCNRRDSHYLGLICNGLYFIIMYIYKQICVFLFINALNLFIIFKIFLILEIFFLEMEFQFQQITHSTSEFKVKSRSRKGTKS